MQVMCSGTEPVSVIPFHITSLKLVAQSKPANYSGAFASSDPELSTSWYTGAYGSRLNMMPYGFNSILMDRGDRVSIQGDGHPTMAAALVAFAFHPEQEQNNLFNDTTQATRIAAMAHTLSLEGWKLLFQSR